MVSTCHCRVWRPCLSMLDAVLGHMREYMTLERGPGDIFSRTYVGWESMALIWFDSIEEIMVVNGGGTGTSNRASGVAWWWVVTCVEMWQAKWWKEVTCMTSLLKVCLVVGLVQVASSKKMVNMGLDLVKNANMLVDTWLLE